MFFPSGFPQKVRSLLHYMCAFSEEYLKRVHQRFLAETACNHPTSVLS
jgi:hypothetical protein